MDMISFDFGFKIIESNHTPIIFFIMESIYIFFSIMSFVNPFFPPLLTPAMLSKKSLAAKIIFSNERMLCDTVSTKV